MYAGGVAPALPSTGDLPDPKPLHLACVLVPGLVMAAASGTLQARRDRWTDGDKLRSWTLLLLLTMKMSSPLADQIGCKYLISANRHDGTCEHGLSLGEAHQMLQGS